MSPSGSPSLALPENKLAVVPPIAVTANSFRNFTSQRNSLGLPTVLYSYLAFFLYYLEDILLEIYCVHIPSIDMFQ